MRSTHKIEESETNSQDGPAPRLQRRLAPEGSEAAYERLSAYAFARRYVGGKAVADIVVDRQEDGEAGYGTYGSSLLAESAESVAVLLSSGSPEAESAAWALHSAPNVTHRGVELPRLPYPEGSFDVVVAFGVVEELERPEELLREAKRVLKGGGVLLLSAPDKQADASGGDRRGLGGQRGMYVAELRELVGCHFEGVHIYRQGAVAGGLIFPDTEEAAGAAVRVEVARFSSAELDLARFGAAPPSRTRSVIAVCYDEAPGREEQDQPYLLLDRGQGVFEESEDLAEDVELMLGEIEQMQQSEVQAFVEVLKAQRQQNLSQLQMRYLFHLRSYMGHRRDVTREHVLHLRNVILEDILHRRNIIYGNIYALRKKGIKGSVKGALRRTAALYRRLAAKDGNPD